MSTGYSLAERLGSLLWDLNWQLTVLVLAVWLVSLCCKRLSAGFRYLLWCVVLLRLCFPVNLQLPIGMSGHVEQVAEVSVTNVFKEPVDPVETTPEPVVRQVVEKVGAKPVVTAPVA
ncbi:hypothetical protein, partial [Pontiella sp.]|uniref:hypothetical protein n=1 Tax=Pontiella sp. TaxID=2837462 RepID=UPI003565E48D